MTENEEDLTDQRLEMIDRLLINIQVRPIYPTNP